MNNFDADQTQELTWQDRLMYIAAIVFAVGGTVLLILGEKT